MGKKTVVELLMEAGADRELAEQAVAFSGWDQLLRAVATQMIDHHRMLKETIRQSEEILDKGMQDVHNHSD